MKKFDGVIFDIDGTLASTNELICASFNHIAGKYLQRQFSWKEIQSLFGPTEDEIIKDLMKENFEEARKDYHDYYSAKHSAMAEIYPGMKEIVFKLKKQGVLLSIYTGKGRKSSEITLKEFGIFDYFDMIVSGDDINGQKPSPDGIEVFILKYNLPKDKVLMVGDAPPDILAARNAGIQVASVIWDSYAKERVLEMKSDFVFNSVQELDRFLTGG